MKTKTTDKISVMKAWIEGEPAQTPLITTDFYGNACNFRRVTTDGLNLWSYDQKIGITLKNGHKALLQSRQTNTTKRHVNNVWSVLWKETGHVPELGVNLFAPVLLNVSHGYKGWAVFPPEVLAEAKTE